MNKSAIYSGFIYINNQSCEFNIGQIRNLIEECTRYMIMNAEQPELVILLSIPPLGWNQLQDLLNAMYQTSARIGWELRKPLFRLDIVIKEFCGYRYDIKPSIEFLHSSTTYFTECSYHNIGALGLEQECPYEVYEHDRLMEYQNVAVGGTFDRLHSGHKILLTMAALICTKKLIVGVSDFSHDRLIKKKYFQFIQTLESRIEKVTEFLKKIKAGIIYEVVAIEDDFGPTRTDENIDAIVGSKETERGCHKGI